METADPDVLVASAADKVVSISAILRRAHRAASPVDYWASRSVFIARVPYFRAFAAEAAPCLPSGLAAELDTVVSLAAEASTRYREQPRSIAVSRRVRKRNPRD